MARRRPPPRAEDRVVVQLEENLASAERMLELMVGHDPVAYNNGGTGGSDPEGTRARWESWTDACARRVAWLRERIAEEEARLGA